MRRLHWRLRRLQRKLTENAPEIAAARAAIARAAAGALGATALETTARTAAQVPAVKARKAT